MSDLESILLVLGAREVNRELQVEIGPISSSLIPLSNQAVIEHHSLERSGFDNLYFYIDKHDLKALEICRLRKLNVIIGDGNLEINHAVFDAISGIQDIYNQKECSITLCYADTIYEKAELFETSNANVIGIGVAPDANSWMTVKLENQEITFQGEEDSSSVVIGLFKFSSMTFLRECLNQTDDFWSALSEYHLLEPFTLNTFKSWLDLGRLDTIFQSRRHFLKSRAFNDINTTEDNQIVIKSSSFAMKKKIQDEINWYKTLNSAQKSLVPNLFDYNINQACYSLEYKSLFTSAEVFMFGDLPKGYWQRFFKGLTRFVEIMHIEETNLDTKHIEKCENQMYLTKFEMRAEIVRKANPNLFETEFVFNGKKLPSLNDFWQDFNVFFSKQVKPGKHAFIHGDLFLGNLFYDRRAGAVSAIDPRGNFGLCETTGDTRYDYAKLSHSILGKYDSLASDLFNFRRHSSKIVEIEVLSSLQNQFMIESLFTEWLIDRECDYKTIRTIEALIFLSLPTLHSESIERQHALIANGIQIAQECMDLT